MKTSYFSFGQVHVHHVNGFTYDCDVLVKITSEDPMGTMTAYFGREWSMEYTDEDDVLQHMQYYPRGIKELS